MKHGAIDFLEKPVDEGALLDAVIRAVARGRAWREARAGREAATRRLATLTPREREVFSQVALGKPNKRIAAELGTTEKTIKVHRGRVMQKLGGELGGGPGPARAAGRIRSPAEPSPGRSRAPPPRLATSGTPRWGEWRGASGGHARRSHSARSRRGGSSSGSSVSLKVPQCMATKRARAEVVERLHRLLGVHVLLAHEPARGRRRRWAAAPRRARGSAGRSPGSPRSRRCRPSGRRARRALDHEAAPERLVGVVEAAAAPVLGGDEGARCTAAHVRASSHQSSSVHGQRAFEAGARAEAGDDRGAHRAERGQVQVVVVVVGHERGVDGRQLLDGEPGAGVAADDAARCAAPARGR